MPSTARYYISSSRSEAKGPLFLEMYECEPRKDPDLEVHVSHSKYAIHWEHRSTQFGNGPVPVYPLPKPCNDPIPDSVRRYRRARLCSSYVPLLPYW